MEKLKKTENLIVVKKGEEGLDATIAFEIQVETNNMEEKVIRVTERVQN